MINIQHTWYELKHGVLFNFSRSEIFVFFNAKMGALIQYI